MAVTDFRQIVLGSSLGARLAALLLARQGQKVLHLCPTETPFSGWQQSPPLLTQFLEQLDARSCLRPSQPIACLTDDQRLLLHGPTPLKDELHRELQQDADKLIRFLKDLELTAGKLEDFLWDNEGAPATLSERLLLPARLLRHGLSVASCKRSAAELVRGKLDPASQKLLQTLISGHTLRPLAEMSVAELALCWSELSQPQQIAASALNDVLGKRLQEAGGELRYLDQRAKLGLLPGNRPGVSCGGDQYTADHILIGAGLPAGFTHLPSLNGGYAQHVRLQLESGRPSALLPQQVVTSLAAATPYRLCLAADGNYADLFLPHQAQPDADWLSGSLEELLPFCSFTLQNETPGSQVPKAKGFPGRCQNFELPGKRYWNISGESLFPGLMNTGECLAAMSLASRLAQ